MSQIDFKCIHNSSKTFKMDKYLTEEINGL